MCSEKEPDVCPDRWGDGEGLQDDPPAAGNRGRLRQGILGAAAVVLLGLAWVAVSETFFRPERLLEEARTILAASSKGRDPQTQAATEAEAEALLRRYLDRGGHDRDSAQLLLAAALVRQARGRMGTAPEQGEVEELLRPADPDRCATSDLLIGAQAMASAGGAAQADRLIAAALKRGDHREEVLRLATDFRFFLGIEDEDRARELLELCRELSDLCPSDPYPWQMMAHIYERQGNLEQMVKVRRRLLDLVPQQADETRRWLIETLIALGRASEARKELETLRATAPRMLAEHPLTEARLLHLEGRGPEALSIAKRVLAAEPETPGALLLAGRICLVQARTGEAIAWLDKATQVDPTLPDAHYLLAQAYTRKGENENAKRHAELHRRVLDLRPALYRLERRASEQPGEPQARSELVRLYEELGWRQRAELWRQSGVSAPVPPSQLLWNLHVLD